MRLALGMASVAALGYTAYQGYQWLFPTSGHPLEMDKSEKELATIGDLNKIAKKAGISLVLKDMDKPQKGVTSFIKTTGNWAWWVTKTVASVAVLPPLIAYGNRYYVNVFREHDLKWFVTVGSHIGNYVTFENEEHDFEERFREGSLLNELRGIAAIYDKNPQVEQSKVMLVSGCKTLVSEVAGVVAFMHFMIDSRQLDSADISEAEIYGCHLINSLHTLCSQVESSVNDASIKKQDHISQSLQTFVVDFKTMVRGFTRIIEEID